MSDRSHDVPPPRRYVLHPLSRALSDSTPSRCILLPPGHVKTAVDQAQTLAFQLRVEEHIREEKQRRRRRRSNPRTHNTFSDQHTTEGFTMNRNYDFPTGDLLQARFPVVLFLDIDGVLHPEPALPRHAFCRLPLVEEILMDFPQVEIVISSAWRLEWKEERAQIAGMKEHFSFALRDRVVGVTPDHRQTPASQAPEGLAGYLREWECLDWLRTHRSPGTPYLILDDRAWLFRQDNPHLMIVDCDDGFMPDNEAEFRARLARMVAQANTVSGEP